MCALAEKLGFFFFFFHCQNFRAKMEPEGSRWIIVFVYTTNSFVDMNLNLNYFFKKMSNFFELNYENFRAKSLVEPIGNAHFSSGQESQAPRRASNHREAGKFSYFSITCSGI